MIGLTYICLGLLLLGTALGFTANVNCNSVLPYRTYNIDHAYYATWYGKVGEQLNGTTYQIGHVFSRHVAVNYQCTAEQKAERKTVFWD